MEVEALLNSSFASGRVPSIAQAALSQDDDHTKYPRYFSALNNALEEEPPPYDTSKYGEIFQEVSTDGHWMARSLIISAEREGDGATRLWSMSACSPIEKEKALLKQHAIDESRHSLAYLSLLDLVFPEAVTPEFRKELKQLSPHYTQKQTPTPVEGSPYARVPSVDDYIQMNIAEIRTTIHHIMQRAALVDYCPPENVERMRKILDGLARDELNHVAYTARLIEDRTNDSELNKLSQMFSKRMRDFNDITHEELGNRIFD